MLETLVDRMDDCNTIKYLRKVHFINSNSRGESCKSSPTSARTYQTIKIETLKWMWSPSPQGTIQPEGIKLNERLDEQTFSIASSAGFHQAVTASGGSVTSLDVFLQIFDGLGRYQGQKLIRAMNLNGVTG